MNIKPKFKFGGRIFLYFAFFLSCSSLFAQSSNEESAGQLINDLITAFEKQDITLHEAIWSQSDELQVIGVFENSNFFGWNEFRNHLEKTFKAAKKIDFSLKQSIITFSEDERTGWFFMLVDETIELPAKTIHLKNMRYTGVIEFENTDWKIVQFHGSLPFKN